MNRSAYDSDSVAVNESPPRADPRKLALAIAIVLSPTTVVASVKNVDITSAKAVLLPLIEQVNIKQLSGSEANSDQTKSTQMAYYGRNFENYQKNFENYQKNFENYQKNFENYGRNFENPLAGPRALDSYSAVRLDGMLPNGAAVPESVDQLLSAIAARAA